jgi:hypothetical protein
MGTVDPRRHSVKPGGKIQSLNMTQAGTAARTDDPLGRLA